MKRRLVLWLLARLGIRYGYIEIPYGGSLRIEGGTLITGYDLRVIGRGAGLSGVWRRDGATIE